jgi:hypothetical protein
MRVVSLAAFVTEVPSFRLVEYLRALADAASECVECEEHWTACLGCSVTADERRAGELLRQGVLPCR